MRDVAKKRSMKKGKERERQTDRQRERQRQRRERKGDLTFSLRSLLSLPLSFKKFFEKSAFSAFNA